MIAAIALAGLYAPPPHCSACSFNAGEAFIHTLPGDAMPKGQWAFGLRADWIEFDGFSDAELLAHAGQGVYTHSIERSYALRAGAAYALSDNWSVGADLPFISNRDLHEAVDNGGTPEVESNGDQTGLGDLSLFAQWKVLGESDSRSSLSLYFGAELPTGETDVHSPAGELLEPDHQPGSGSTDVFAGIGFSRSFERTSIAASVLGTLAGDGSQDSNLGDVLRVNAGWGWSPDAPKDATLWRWMLELNGQWHEPMRMAGAIDENSGGFQLFLAPGLRVTWSSHVTWFASFGVPLVQNLDGAQAETSFRASTGIGFSL